MDAEEVGHGARADAVDEVPDGAAEDSGEGELEPLPVDGALEGVDQDEDEDGEGDGVEEDRPVGRGRPRKEAEGGAGVLDVGDVEEAGDDDDPVVHAGPRRGSSSSSPGRGGRRGPRGRGRAPGGGPDSRRGRRSRLPRVARIAWQRRAEPGVVAVALHLPAARALRPLGRVGRDGGQGGVAFGRRGVEDDLGDDEELGEPGLVEAGRREVGHEGGGLLDLGAGLGARADDAVAAEGLEGSDERGADVEEAAPGRVLLVGERSRGRGRPTWRGSETFPRGPAATPRSPRR